MARLTGGNGRIATVAMSIAAVFFSIIVAMLGFWINQQNEALEEARGVQVVNGNRLTAIETRLGRIEDDIREIRND